jgi:LysR family transcriptional regulator, transcription activator of glutamate synthase operon
LELRQIQYFIEVAKREHVTEAAAALNVAQSAVSRQIFNLESELGVNLFIREGRNVILTPIGKSFLNNMELIIKLVENAKREVQEYLDPERGTIRIGYPSSMAIYILPTSIAAFRNRYPNVKFQLHQSSYHQLVEGVVNGKFDIAMLGSVPKQESKVVGKILFSENFVALLPRNHPLSQKRFLKLNQLKDDSFILYPQGYSLNEIVVKACRECGYTPKVLFEGEDIESIKGLVVAGLGITLLPENTLIDAIPTSTVKIPIVDPPISRTVGVIIPCDRSLLPTEKLFYEFLIDYYKQLERFSN